MRLKIAMLYVKSMPHMAQFYSETLGLKPVEETRTESWLELEAGSVVLGLHAISPHIAEGIEISNPPEPREETPLKLLFEVEDLQVEVDRLHSLGVQLIQRPWGNWDGVDPEGNIFGLSAARPKS
ncbi:VOC family protein [uncultured Paludibaculum sp.]|uniref:VOC family protein n=1 Tax=uncultured Paludibaculum sp. TaxID=1765020 RepID=UPI002AABA13B|nr:VOC family protein [uncultured Paludibaculum sp.]